MYFTSRGSIWPIRGSPLYGRRCAGVVQGAGVVWATMAKGGLRMANFARRCRIQVLDGPMGHLRIKPHPLSVSPPPVVHGETCLCVPCLRSRPMPHASYKQELGLTSSSILRTIPPASNPPFAHGSTLPVTIVSCDEECHIFLRLYNGSA